MPKKTTSFPSFDSPAQLLAAYDPSIRDGKVKIYPWQIKVMKKFAEEPPPGKMNDIDVVAANGSGKSKMIVAPCATYIASQFDKAEVVLTTASGQQLDRQSARFLRDTAAKMNVIHPQAWEIQHRKLVFTPTDGIIDLFATDEAGQAEGWHQRDYDTSFTIIVDEAKSLNEEIYTALDRCHDAQRYLKVSSPGQTSGTFYKSYTSGKTSSYRISAYDCPHISKDRIERIIGIYGRYSPKTRSIIDALFSSEDEQIVITKEAIDNLFTIPPILENSKGFPLRVGGDLAAGGDENVISIWRGNRQLGLEPFVEKDTTVTVIKIELILNKYQVEQDNDHMFFDDGGVGRAIIDMLRRRGWNIKRVLNQSKALGGDLTSGNRGAELWFKFASYIINRELIMINDIILREQLGNRFYRQQAVSGKHVLESKREAKAKGHPSPDRADATVLAFTDVPLGPYFSLLGGEKQEEVQTTVTQKELVEMMDRFKYKDFDREVKEKVMMDINGSMSALIHPDYITPEEIAERFGWN